MRIWAVLFERAQKGWRCTLTFTYPSTQQFTDVTDCVTDGAKWWPLAYVRARRAAKQFCRIHSAKPGERAALGWSD